MSGWREADELAADSEGVHDPLDLRHGGAWTSMVTFVETSDFDRSPEDIEH